MSARVEWTTLVQAEDLAALLVSTPGATAIADDGGLVVFDCRFALNDTGAGERAWREARLPGARYAHLDRDLSGPHSAGAGRHPWPQASAFADWLGQNGVGTETQVVAYDGGDGAFAARLWCLLRAFGHRRVAVLDGGWARWIALGLPVDAASPAHADAHAAPARTYTHTHAHTYTHTHDAPATVPEFERERLLDADAVRARLAAGDALIDARAAERYRGEVEPIDRVAGHVPGAINRPYAMNLHDGRFKSPQALGEEFRAALGGREPRRAIMMCGSGVTACHHLLALAHAGLDGAALYAGSWSGWIEDPQRPVALGDVGGPSHRLP